MSKRRKPPVARPATATEVAPISVSDAGAVGQLDLCIDEHIERSALVVNYVADIAPVGAGLVADGEGAESALAAPFVAPHEEAVALVDASIEQSESEAATPEAIAQVPEESKQTLGERFRSIRESRGISREEMARRLRVSPSVVQDIESDQWDRLGAPVYVRGHLTSYAKTLDVPTVVVSVALRDLDEPAPLSLSVAARERSSWWGRYSSAATYVVLTLLLAIPIVTILDYRGVTSSVPRTQQVRSMEDNEAGLLAAGPRHLLPQADEVLEFVGPPESAAGASVSSWTAPSASNAPLMASMTPIGSSLQSSELQPGMHRVEMRISQDTWLEIVDSAGTRLDYGIVRAGERRVHEVNGTVAMSIGNVGGVVLLVDGKPVDLLPFARLNVARLKLFEPQPTSAVPSR